MSESLDIMQKLLNKANTLPMRPGVYIMKNAAGSVIYVGKAIKLKNRVVQYFRSGEKNVKTAAMVSSVRDFEYYVCNTDEPYAEEVLNVILKNEVKHECS